MLLLFLVGAQPPPRAPVGALGAGYIPMLTRPETKKRKEKQEEEEAILIAALIRARFSVGQPKP